MKKLYEEPEIQIRNYSRPLNGIITTSDEIPTETPSGPDLEDGEDYPYFG